MNLLLLPLLFLFAVPQDPPKKKGLAKGAIALGDKGQGRSKRIPGGSEHEFRGVRFDLPKGWTFTASDDGAEIAPKGANQKGQVEEKYTLIHDGDLHALDGDEIKESVQELADAVQDGLKAQKPEKAAFGDLDGRVFAFRGESEGGKAIAVRVHAFLAGGSVCVLAAMGYADRIDARQADLTAILDSMRTGKAEGDAPARPDNPLARRPKPAKGEDEQDEDPAPPPPKPKPKLEDPVTEDPTEPPAAPKGGKRKPIAGGVAKTYQGVSFDLPRTWNMNTSNEGTTLVPQGANAQGILEEAYVLVNDPQVKTLDGEAVQNSVDEAVQQIQNGAERKGPVQKVRFGDVEGRLYVYGAADPQGRKIEVRVHGFLGKTGACALVALGYADVLGKRQKELQAILDSMGAPAAGRKAPAGGGDGEVREELVGEWAWITQFNANNGGGRQTNTVLKLNGDGSYNYFGMTDSYNPLGGATSETRERGTWTATEDSITLTANGNARTFQLEKRNHPKNVNDPMIVLDGKAFVTTTQREPWR